MTDELTEYFIRGVQQGEQAAVNRERAKVSRETQTRLTEALAARTAANPPRRGIPPELISSLVDEDATPEQVADAFTRAGGYDLETAKQIATLGAQRRAKVAAIEAQKLTQQEYESLRTANPEAASGIQPGLDRGVARDIYGQANQNQRDASAAPSNRPPPVSPEEKQRLAIEQARALRDDAESRAAYHKGYTPNESDVPKKVADELAMRYYRHTLEFLEKNPDKLNDGPAKGMRGAEVASWLLGLGSEVQVRARGGMPLAKAIEEVGTAALPRPDSKGKKRLVEPPPVQATGNGRTPGTPGTAEQVAPPVAAQGGLDRGKVEAAMARARTPDGRVSPRKLFAALGLNDTPENRAAIEKILGGR